MMDRRSRTFGIIGIVVLVALFALLPIASAAPLAATQTVEARDFEFAPKMITVNVGDTVVWKNVGQAEHTVTADDGSFDSDDLEAGQEFSFTFNTAGTFPYYCKYHGAKGGSGMAGTVVVQEAAAAQPQPTAAPAEQAPAPTGSLEASDQPVTDGTVTVASVTSSVPGWMVIHLDEGGKPGTVIGHTAVPQGDSRDVKVKLEQNVTAGTKLWPMLHIDAGTMGTYEFPGPDAPVIVGGNIVMKQITVTEAAAAPAAQPPAQQLPRTGGAELPATLLLAALALIATGVTLTLRRRRRA
jgi:LPXTG-motif cell wall-anchored protein